MKKQGLSSTWIGSLKLRCLFSKDRNEGVNLFSWPCSQSFITKPIVAMAERKLYYKSQNWTTIVCSFHSFSHILCLYRIVTRFEVLFSTKSVNKGKKHSTTIFFILFRYYNNIWNNKFTTAKSFGANHTVCFSHFIFISLSTFSDLVFFVRFTFLLVTGYLHKISRFILIDLVLKMYPKNWL